MTSVILVKIEVVLKEPFQLFKFFGKMFSDALFSIGSSGFDFIDGVVIDELGNNYRLLIIEKWISSSIFLKSFFSTNPFKSARL